MHTPYYPKRKRPKQMHTLSTRQATQSNLPRIAALFDAYRQFYQQAADLNLATEFIGERMRRNESVIFLAENDQREALGFCQLYPTFCSVEAKPILALYDLYVLTYTYSPAHANWVWAHCFCKQQSSMRETAVLHAWI